MFLGNSGSSFMMMMHVYRSYNGWLSIYNQKKKKALAKVNPLVILFVLAFRFFFVVVRSLYWTELAISLFLVAILVNFVLFCFVLWSEIFFDISKTIDIHKVVLFFRSPANIRQNIFGIVINNDDVNHIIRGVYIVGIYDSHMNEC